MDGWVGVSMWFETYSTLRYQILTFWLKIWNLWFCFLWDASYPSHPPSTVASFSWTMEARSPWEGSAFAGGHWMSGLFESPCSFLRGCFEGDWRGCNGYLWDRVLTLRPSYGLVVRGLLSQVRRHWHLPGRLSGVWRRAASLSPVWGWRGHLRRRTRGISPEPPPAQCRRGGDGVLDHGLGNRIRPARRGGDGHRDHLRGIGTPYRPNRRRDPPRVQGPGRG